MQGAPLKQRYRFVVIGAGITGLTTAQALAKAYPGEVLVLEREDAAGGMARTLSRQGFKYDLGSHRIHKDIEAGELSRLQQWMGSDLLLRPRAGKLRFGKRYVDYPIETLQFFLALGVKDLCGFAASWGRRRLDLLRPAGVPACEDTYEGYLRRRVGDRVYRIFYEPYARKVFGLDPALISVLAVKKRISLSRPLGFLKKVAKHLLGSKTPGGFYYFKQGIGSLAQALEQSLYQARGVLVKQVRDIVPGAVPGQKEITWVLPDGARFTAAYGSLVSTIPINALCRKLGFEGTLDPRMWRGLRLVFLHLSKPPALGGETFYYPELKYPFGRVSVPQRFSAELQPEGSPVSCICEVPCSPGDLWWEMPDQEIARRCFEALQDAELLSPDTTMEKSLNFTLRVPEVYAVYFLGWEKAVQTMLGFLASEHPSVYSSGRLGLFLHCNMDHAMIIGRELASGLLSGISAKDWYARLPEWHQMKVRD